MSASRQQRVWREVRQLVARRVEAPYALARIVDRLDDERERAEVLRYALHLWRRPVGWGVEELKREHAYGVALGRALCTFSRRRAYQCWLYAPDTQVEVGFGVAEVHRADGHRPGFYLRVESDGSLFGACDVAVRWLSVAMVDDAPELAQEMLPAWWTPQRRAEELGRLATIEDPALRQIVFELRHGNPVLVPRVEDCVYFRQLFEVGVSERELSLVTAWEAAPPMFDVGVALVSVTI